MGSAPAVTHGQGDCIRHNHRLAAFPRTRRGILGTGPVASLSVEVDDAGIDNCHSRFVHEQLAGTLEVNAEPVHNGCEMRGSLANQANVSGADRSRRGGICLTRRGSEV